ncbi:MAG: FIST N-terminal domain-containing protein [Clostridium sp.]|nr:FIST N-terminal domain-containing protein [Clostridium sp.]
MADDAQTAVIESTTNLHNPKLIIYFSKISYFKEVTSLLKEKFMDAEIIGCTSCGEISKKGINDGVSLIAFENNIEFKTMVMKNIDKAPITYIEKLKDFKKGFNTQNTILFELTDGMSNAEEKSLSVLSSVFEEDNIPIVGASSADDLKFEKTFLAYNGEIYSNVTILTLLHNNDGKINIYKENIYEPTEHQFVVTKASPKDKKIYELDNKPIIKTYAEALNISPKDVSKYFINNPIGRIIGDEVYISSIKKVENDNSLSFYGRVYKNSYVNILKSREPMEVLDKTIRKIKTEMPSISGSIVINCILRTVLFKEKNISSTFTSELQKLGSFAGITCYGEHLNNKLLNQTMIVICFE